MKTKNNGSGKSLTLGNRQKWTSIFAYYNRENIAYYNRALPELAKRLQ